jgi:hypothetical protein
MIRLVIPIVLFCAAITRGAEKVFEFSQLNAGDVPSGFRSVVSGQGKPGEWRIVLDEAPAPTKRPVLAQLSRDRTDEHAPMFIYDGESYGDFKVVTRFKLMEGEVEQMAGIAFRFRDENNYYYVRASGLGNSFYFFKIQNGLRSAPIGPKVEITKGVWHELAVECKGSQIRASLDGKELIPPWEDQSFATGKIGFWTKSDSVSYFADTRVIYAPRENPAQTLVRDTLKKYPRLVGLQIFAGASENDEPKLIASSEATQIGRPAPPEVRDVLARSIPYHGKDRANVIITLPLHEGNGENVAALKVMLKSFPGQTEANALARARVVARWMEQRIQTRKDLFQ